MVDIESPDWSIAACMHPFRAVDVDGVSLHDAEEAVWEDLIAEVKDAGFDDLELADSHIRIADLSPGRGESLRSIAAAYGVAVPSVHCSRRSVIDPVDGEANLAYLHRSIDAAAEWGVQVFSTGLHRPFTQAQEQALWFWTADGPRDPDDAETWETAVSRIRELGRHAAEVGLPMSLELYEDTYLGTADGAVRFVEAVGLDNVGINPDVGNLIRLHRPVEDWREIYAKTLPFANYWHMKNYARDEAGDGSWATSTPSTLELGVINYRQVIRDAVALGFRGIVVTEQYGGDSLGVGATNREYIRSVLSSAGRSSVVAGDAGR